MQTTQRPAFALSVFVAVATSVVTCVVTCGVVNSVAGRACAQATAIEVDQGEKQRALHHVLRVSIESESRFAQAAEDGEIAQDALCFLGNGADQASRIERASPHIGRRLLVSYLRSLSPDGKLVAFTKQADGKSELYSCLPDGSGETRLRIEDGRVTSLSWSQDRKRIVYLVDRDGRSRLRCIDVATKIARDCVDYEGQVREPRFANRGDALAFLGEAKGRERRGKLPPLRDIVVVDENGQRVLCAEKSIWGYEFSPDGNLLVLSTDGAIEFYDAASGRRVLALPNKDISKSAFAHATHRFVWRADSGAVAFGFGFLGGRMAGTVVPGDHDVYVLELETVAEQEDGAARLRATIHEIKLGEVCESSAELRPAIVRFERRRRE